jgi:CheY-like chemotaxis protein
MVIDDSNTIRKTAEIFLLQAGAQVVLAEDGFDALAKINDHLPQRGFLRHPDAPARRLSDLRADQEEPEVRVHSGDHAFHPRTACSTAPAGAWSVPTNT